MTNETIAAATPIVPRTATGITTGSDLTVSALSGSGDQRKRGLLLHCFQRLCSGRLLAIPWELKFVASSGGRSPEPAFTRRWTLSSMPPRTDNR